MIALAWKARGGPRGVLGPPGEGMWMSRQVLDRYFEALRSQDWESLAACLAEDVRRTGPYLDVVQGKEAYVEFLAGVIPTLLNYELKVHGVRPLEGGSALVLLSEILARDGVQTEFPEALVFDFDDAGLIQRVDIYIKQPPRVRAEEGEASG